MKYKIGDKVRIKSLDWYNKNKDVNGIVELSTHVFIPEMAEYCGMIVTIKDVFEDIDNNVVYYMEEIDCDWTDEMIEGLVEEETKPKDMGEMSDGYHTFNELYEYRMLYNAALFNEFAKQGLYDVHKSRKHSDGEYPFGDSNWFIVMAELPTGQISNHYEMKDWDKFQIPEKPLANKWDEHSPRDVTNRLTSFTNPKKEYPKTYEECCTILGFHYDHYLTYDDEKNLPVSQDESDFIDTVDDFAKLLICKKAYWKIAGEEMGLGKPWEPDWGNPDHDSYSTITRCGGKIIRTTIYTHDCPLSFPTEEMRDAFYENFKKLIESCKELL